MHENFSSDFADDAPMRPVMIFAALAIAAGLSVPHYFTSMNDGRPAAAMMAQRSATPAAATPSNSRSVVVSHDRNGHFQVEGHVDGRRMEFMVDTGASVVALTASDAAMLGIHPAEREFTAVVKTANGIVRAAPTQLDRVEVGDLTVRNVAAMVLPDGALSDNLLGLSFLSRLRRFEYSNGRLVLEQ
jgi:aspartyl protease family protein